MLYRWVGNFQLEMCFCGNAEKRFGIQGKVATKASCWKWELESAAFFRTAGLESPGVLHKGESMKSVRKVHLFADTNTTVCSYCGCLLRGKKFWEKERLTPQEISLLPVSHGICSSCLVENFPDEYDAILKDHIPANLRV